MTKSKMALLVLGAALASGCATVGSKCGAGKCGSNKTVEQGAAKCGAVKAEEPAVAKCASGKCGSGK